MTDLIPSTIEFYDITPRIHRLFAEVWAAIPANERDIIETRLRLVDALRHREYNRDIDGIPYSALTRRDGTIELAQWDLRRDDWARHIIAHELAHVLLHHEDTKDREEYRPQIELEADQKAKDWGYEKRKRLILYSHTPTPEEAAKIHGRKPRDRSNPSK